MSADLRRDILRACASPDLLLELLEHHREEAIALLDVSPERFDAALAAEPSRLAREVRSRLRSPASDADRTASLDAAVLALRRSTTWTEDGCAVLDVPALFALARAARACKLVSILWHCGDPYGGRVVVDVAVIRRLDTRWRCLREWRASLDADYLHVHWTHDGGGGRLRLSAGAAQLHESALVDLTPLETGP